MTQVRTLEDLAAEGRPTRSATEKAAHVIAVQTQFMHDYLAASRIEDAAERKNAQAICLYQYHSHRTRPFSWAEFAGGALAALTVDDMEGLVAVLRQEQEGQYSRLITMCYVW